MARNHGRNDTTHTHTQKKYTLDVARWVHCGNWVTSRQPTTMHTSKWHYTSRCFSLRPPLYPLPFVFILTSTLSSYSFIYRLRPKKKTTRISHTLHHSFLSESRKTNIQNTTRKLQISSAKEGVSVDLPK